MLSRKTMWSDIIKVSFLLSAALWLPLVNGNKQVFTHDSKSYCTYEDDSLRICNFEGLNIVVIVSGREGNETRLRIDSATTVKLHESTINQFKELNISNSKVVSIGDSSNQQNNDIRIVLTNCSESEVSVGMKYFKAERSNITKLHLSTIEEFDLIECNVGQLEALINSKKTTIDNSTVDEMILHVEGESSLLIDNSTIKTIRKLEIRGHKPTLIKNSNIGNIDKNGILISEGALFIEYTTMMLHHENAILIIHGNLTFNGSKNTNLHEVISTRSILMRSGAFLRLTYYNSRCSPCMVTFGTPEYMTGIGIYPLQEIAFQSHILLVYILAGCLGLSSIIIILLLVLFCSLSPRSKTETMKSEVTKEAKNKYVQLENVPLKSNTQKECKPPLNQPKKFEIDPNYEDWTKRRNLPKPGGLSLRIQKPDESLAEVDDYTENKVASNSQEEYTDIISSLPGPEPPVRNESLQNFRADKSKQDDSNSDQDEYDEIAVNITQKQPAKGKKPTFGGNDVKVTLNKLRNGVSRFTKPPISPSSDLPKKDPDDEETNIYHDIV